MKPTIRDCWALIKQTFTEWSEDKVPQLGAALAFYTALSIAPLLVISLGVASMVFGEDAARGEIQHQMDSLVGEERAKAIEEMIANANKPATGAVATALGVITLLFGASGVFGQIQQSLNTIWEVQPKPGRGIAGMIRDRFLSLAMVFGIAFLLLVSLIISAAMASLTSFLDNLPEALQWLGQAVEFGVSFAVISIR